MKFYVVCAWCGADLGVKECETGEETENNISHSICEPCKDRVINEESELTVNTSIPIERRLL